jgi:hypothetical protein
MLPEHLLTGFLPETSRREIEFTSFWRYMAVVDSSELAKTIEHNTKI